MKTALTSFLTGFLLSCVLLIYAADRIQSAVTIYLAGFLSAALLVLWATLLFNLWPHIHQSVIGTRRGHIPTTRYLIRSAKPESAKFLPNTPVRDLPKTERSHVAAEVADALHNLGMSKAAAKSKTIEILSNWEGTPTFENVFRECVR